MTERAAAEDRAAGAAWLLPLLVCAAGWLVLDGLWDAPVFKLSALGLLCALIVAPVLACFGRDALGAWFGGSAARLLVASTALAALGSLGATAQASVSDQLILFGLAQLAAVCGLAAARQRPAGLLAALRLCGLLVALVCWAQALGLEHSLTPGPEEVVGLSGNSTRAGALLALVLAGSLVAWVTRAPPDSRPRSGLAPDLAHGALLVIVAGALLLTRARGARWALGAALLVLALVALRRRTNWPGLRLAGAGLALGVGVILATWVGGSDALLGRKLETSAPVLSGHDPTTGVRLALFGTALEMSAEHPWLGVGLGRFRQFAPRYRDPGEAALPGLAGGVTEAEHPHNEWLLRLAEGGWPAALLLALALLLTLRRGVATALAERSSCRRVALAVFVAGLALGLVQDAWSDPASAVPFFAAMGFLWAPRPDETRAGSAGPGWLGAALASLPFGIASQSVARRVPAWLSLALLPLGLGLGLLAWPRFDTQMSLRSFYRQTDRAGVITPAAYQALAHAAQVGAGDPAAQRMLLDMAPLFLQRLGGTSDRDLVQRDMDAARQRLVALKAAGI